MINHLKSIIKKNRIFPVYHVYIIVRWFFYKITILLKNIKHEYLIIISPSFYFLREGDSSLKKIYHIKDRTIEELSPFRVCNIYDSGAVKLYHPAQDIFEIENGSVFSKSDIVLTQQGVFWDKRYFENFSVIIPLDRNLLSYNENKVVLRKSKHILKRDTCFSMLGTHAEHWAHFLVQYLPKLYYMKEAGLLENKITILFPNYKDNQIRQIVTEFLSPYKNVNYEFIDTDTEIKCNKLIFIPAASILADHAKYISIVLCVIPANVTSRIQSYLVNPLIKKTEHISNNISKIYLVRRGARTVINYKEVEEFFVSRGFQLVEPHLLSLEEKVALFNRASIIAGPTGSAFANLIFCREMTKILIFTNFPRIMDLYLPGILKCVNLNILCVVGKDDNDDVHTSYRISLNKIDDAYNQLLME
jgi:hypothetical protein